MTSLTHDFHRCGRLCLPVGVPGRALVHAALLRVDLEQVQGHVVKVVGRPVLVTCSFELIYEQVTGLSIK